jgi:hypothetical protein
VGGVVTIMDYANHALAHGLRVSVRCPREFEPDLPLFRIDRLAPLTTSDAVRFHSEPTLILGARDLVFVSLPTDYEVAFRSLPTSMSPERIIHIVQNVRHTTPTWLGGYPLRLLTRPAARISTNSIVHDVVAPWLDPRGVHEVIDLGHDLGYFRRDRIGTAPSSPMRVGYTTWKSSLGDDVAARLAGEGFEFRAIREAVAWDELKELYHWADVFLCTPNPEEGFYMPGLEAMEAGCVVVTPDAGGNMAYCRPGSNCVLVGFDDLDAYVAALRSVASWGQSELDAVRAAGYASTEPFDLDRERAAFGGFIERLWPRIDAHETQRG